MSGEPPGGWPNRGPELIRTASVMATLATLMAGWRLVVRFRMNPRMGMSDWLMLGGVVSCSDIYRMLCSLTLNRSSISSGASLMLSSPPKVARAA